MIRRLDIGGIAAFTALNAVGAAFLALALFETLRERALYASPGFLSMLLAALLAGSLAIRLPGLRSLLSLSDSVAYLSVLFFGPWPAIVVASLDAFAGTIRHTRRPLSVASSVTVIASSVGLGALAYRGTAAALAARTTLHPDAILALALGAMCVAHYLANSWQIALLTARSRRLPVFSTWRDNYLWTAHSFLVAGVIAGLVFLLIRQYGPLVVLIPLVLLAGSYLAYRRYLGQLDEKNRHIVTMAHTQASALEALATAMDARGQSTVGHVSRVRAYASALGELAGLDSEEIEGLKTAALLHDIGRLGIPDQILNKPGSLSKEEMAKVRTYPRIGARIMAGVGFPGIVQQAIRQHRERWDGLGYPDGLKGKEISVAARILSLVDAADAMRSPRNYRPARSREEMIHFIQAGAGKEFDPRLVNLFLENLDAIEAVGEDQDLPEWEDLAEIHANQRESALLGPVAGDVYEALDDISAARREATLLFEFVGSLGHSLGLNETIQVTMDNLERVFDVEGGAIYLAAEGDALSLSGAMAGDSGALPDTLDPSCKLLRDAIAEERVVAGAVTGQTQEILGPAAKAFRTLAILPLQTARRLEGICVLFSRREDAFSEDDRRLFTIIASQIATAVANAARYEESRRGALTDPLTGLPNMRYFHEKVERKLQESVHPDARHGVVVFDLDHFKQLNDLCGHEVGDEALKAVAEYLARHLRDGDDLCRWGGDEFIAVLPRVEAPEIERIVRRIQDNIGELDLESARDRGVELGVSAGWAMFPADGRTLVDLLRVADKRMYRDKAERRHEAGISRFVGV